MGLISTNIFSCFICLYQNLVWKHHSTVEWGFSSFNVLLDYLWYLPTARRLLQEVYCRIQFLYPILRNLTVSFGCHEIPVFSQTHPRFSALNVYLKDGRWPLVSVFPFSQNSLFSHVLRGFVYYVTCQNLLSMLNLFSFFFKPRKKLAFRDHNQSDMRELITHCIKKKSQVLDFQEIEYSSKKNSWANVES